MARQEIILGTPPQGLGGDPPRTASTKINAMTTEVYAALGGSGANLALPAALPVVKGGTGAANAEVARTNLGFKNETATLWLANLGVRRSALDQLGANGGYIGWNGNEVSGFFGEMNFICNRGGGSGGFTWRSVNASNTESGPAMTLTYAGVLNVPAGIQLNGRNIVERGSNSNGDYIRLSDGTQICWKRITTDASSNAVGPIFGSGAFGAGSYPAAFVEIPKVSHSGYIASGTVNAMWSGCYSIPSQTNWGNYRLLSAGAYGPGYIDVIAIGRWF